MNGKGAGRKTTIRKNDDVISRQAAIDVLDKNHILGRGDLNEVLDHIVERLDKLPSAQPDLSEYSDKLWRNAYERGKRDAQPEIIRCKDCKYYREYGYVNGTSKFLPKCTFNSIYVNADDFCSRAERKEE